MNIISTALIVITVIGFLYFGQKTKNPAPTQNSSPKLSLILEKLPWIFQNENMGQQVLVSIQNNSNNEQDIFVTGNYINALSIEIRDKKGNLLEGTRNPSGAGGIPFDPNLWDIRKILPGQVIEVGVWNYNSNEKVAWLNGNGGWKFDDMDPTGFDLKAVYEIKKETCDDVVKYLKKTVFCGRVESENIKI